MSETLLWTAAAQKEQSQVETAETYSAENVEYLLSESQDQKAKLQKNLTQLQEHAIYFAYCHRHQQFREAAARSRQISVGETMIDTDFWTEGGLTAICEEFDALPDPAGIQEEKEAEVSRQVTAIGVLFSRLQGCREEAVRRFSESKSRARIAGRICSILKQKNGYSVLSHGFEPSAAEGGGDPRKNYTAVMGLADISIQFTFRSHGYIDVNFLTSGTASPEWSGRRTDELVEMFQKNGIVISRVAANGTSAAE